MDSTSEAVAPLVSIQMLTYNRALLIRQAILSVVNQTYKNWELTVLDDGSTDETEEVIESFGDSRIRYLRNATNIGVSQSRMRALAKSKGKYIAVLDSDDEWSGTTKLAEQVAFLEANPGHAVVGTFVTIIDSTGNEIGTTTYCTEDSAIRKQILLRNQFAHSSILMRSRMVLDAGGYTDQSIGEDYDLLLRLGGEGAFANIPLFLTKYRIHSGGVSSDNLGMALAIHGYVWKYRNLYPRSRLALLKSILRILLARMVRDARKFSVLARATRKGS